MKKILLFTSLLFFTQSILSQCYESLTFGGLHTIAQKADGTLWGWGQADAGQVMTTNNVEPLPIQMGVASDWDLIETGTQNTFGIKNDGTLWGCGRNTFGALGINSTTEINPTFQQITTSNDWVKVSASHFFALALKSDGTIWAWGQNDYYQLGNSPATPEQLSPIQVGTDTDWVEISAGTSRTAFAIKSDGTIWGWGFNTTSLLIFGVTPHTVSSPIQIGTDTDWLTMSVGGGIYSRRRPTVPSGHGEGGLLVDSETFLHPIPRNRFLLTNGSVFPQVAGVNPLLLNKMAPCGLGVLTRTDG